MENVKFKKVRNTSSGGFFSGEYDIVLDGKVIGRVSKTRYGWNARTFSNAERKVTSFGVDRAIAVRLFVEKFEEVTQYREGDESVDELLTAESPNDSEWLGGHVGLSDYRRDAAEWQGVI